MESRKISTIGVFFLCAAYLYAQTDKQPYTTAGLFRSVLTISPSSKQNIYLHGNIEYYTSSNVSFRGDVYYSVKTKIQNLAFLHALFSGVSYHLPSKGYFDSYVFFQPGISMTQKIYQGNCIAIYPPPPECADSKTVANPLISGGIGFNYYFQRWFHLLAEMRYVYGNHIAEVPPVISLSELRFSFGLGWNLNFK